MNDPIYPIPGTHVPAGDGDEDSLVRFAGVARQAVLEMRDEALRVRDQGRTQIDALKVALAEMTADRDEWRRRALDAAKLLDGARNTQESPEGSAQADREGTAKEPGCPDGSRANAAEMTAVAAPSSDPVTSEPAKLDTDGAPVTVGAPFDEPLPPCTGDTTSKTTVTSATSAAPPPAVESDDEAERTGGAGLPPVPAPPGPFVIMRTTVVGRQVFVEHPVTGAHTWVTASNLDAATKYPDILEAEGTKRGLKLRRTRIISLADIVALPATGRADEAQAERELTDRSGGDLEDQIDAALAAQPGEG